MKTTISSIILLFMFQLLALSQKMDSEIGISNNVEMKIDSFYCGKYEVIMELPTDTSMDNSDDYHIFFYQRSFVSDNVTLMIQKKHKDHILPFGRTDAVEILSVERLDSSKTITRGYLYLNDTIKVYFREDFYIKEWLNIAYLTARGEKSIRFERILDDANIILSQDPKKWMHKCPEEYQAISR